ncbi:hypothetical protein JCM17823_08780 [Halorubrum gandharaense]
MDLPVSLRFVGAAVATAVVVFVGALLIGSGIPGVVDGLFLIGVVAALIAVLFTRPSVFRKRSIRRAEETDDEREDVRSAAVDEGRSDDGKTSHRSARNDRASASASAGGRRQAETDGSDSAKRDPARTIRIGIGLIAYAGVLLGISVVLQLLAL